MSTIVISTAIRCDRYDGVIRSDRTFQYIPSAIKEMLLVYVRASCFEVTGAWTCAIMLNRQWFLKERGEYSVLALYSG
jgi:hypothetical protein